MGTFYRSDKAQWAALAGKTEIIVIDDLLAVHFAPDGPILAEIMCCPGHRHNTAVGKKITIHRKIGLRIDPDLMIERLGCASVIEIEIAVMRKIADRRLVRDCIHVGSQEFPWAPAYKYT